MWGDGIEYANPKNKSAGYTVVEGDDASQIRVELRNRVGNNDDGFPKYKLLVNSSKTEVAEAIKKDASQKTVILIAHRKTTLDKCDEVLTLKDGSFS